MMAFGVREHGMGGVMVGMSRHGGVLPDRRDLLRLQRLHAGLGAAGRPVRDARSSIFWTHDSVGLGEDGPDPPAGRAAGRHAGHAQPARDPARRRQRDRPGARAAIEHDDGPTALILIPPDLPVLEATAERAHLLAKGAYVLSG